MSRKAAVVISLSLAVIAAVFVRSRMNRHSAPAATPSTVSRPKNEIREIALKPRVATTPINAQAANESEDCKNLWSEIDHLDLKASDNEVRESIRRLDFTRCSPADSRLKGLQQKIAKACAEGKAEAPENKVFASGEDLPCEAYFLFYRSAIHADKNAKIAEIKDFTNLVDLLIDVFAQGNNLDVARMLEIVSRMKELRGDLPIVQKLSLVSQSLDALMGDTAKNNPAYWDRLAAEFDQFDEETKRDPNLADFRILLKTQGMNLEKVMAWAEEVVRTGTDTARGYEAIGYVYWKRGNRAAAILNLERASQVDPQNTWYKDVLSKIRAPGAGIDAYRLTLKLGFSMNELVGI